MSESNQLTRAKMLLEKLNRQNKELLADNAMLVDRLHAKDAENVALVKRVNELKRSLAARERGELPY